MINSEKQIYLQETEIKPNHAAVFVLIATIVIMVTSWIFNELNIFHVDKLVMRIGAGISIVVMAIPLVIVATDRKRFSDPRLKYLMFTAFFVFTMDVVTLLTFHCEIMLLFPMFFAMLYRSKTLGKLALILSVVATITAPVLGYVLGIWDVPLFQELIRIATGGTTEIIDPTYTVNRESIAEILLFISFPRLLAVGSGSVLMFRVISIGTDHVHTEILLNRINNRDNLTELYNQNYYKQFLAAPGRTGNVGVIFFDLNGLKEANDRNGHEYGDLLLKRCAQSIIRICDDVSCSAFRVGGDEFLVVIEGATEPVVIQKIAEWKAALELINHENMIEYNGLICSMAAGYAVGAFSDLENVVSKADALMYKNKALMKSKITEFGSVQNAE